MARKHFEVTELDFDALKDLLKTFLESDSTFSDYNFEGAGLNVLLDTLAYNTHIDAFIANMLGNEMFIDSAELRASVVSRAKELGYVARSARASVAEIDIEINVGSDVGATLTVPAGITFASGTGLTFATAEDRLLYPDDSFVYSPITNINIYEGSLVTFAFDMNALPNQRMQIPSLDADISTLTVTTYLNNGLTGPAVYTLNDNISELTATSESFFVHENLNGYFEVTFGDDVLGKAISAANANQWVVLTYIVATNKADANGETSFLENEAIGAYSGYTITTEATSTNGSEKEDIEDIRYKAPLAYEAQNRAVVTNDYEILILRDYPYIESINSWGGEYNDPPTYGKVFFSIKPSNAEFLSTTLKEQIKDDLIGKYNVVTVMPEIIDPEYIYVGLNVTANYDRSKTTDSAFTIGSTIETAITTYFAENTQKFKMPFYYSPLLTTIDALDVSILNTLIDVTIQKRVIPTTGISQSFAITFGNAIDVNTVSSTYYNVLNTSDEVRSVGITDDGEGSLVAFDVESGEDIETVGTIDYTTGALAVTITPFSLPADQLDLRFTVTPANQNIDIQHNNIILPDESAANALHNRPQGIAVTVTDINKELK